MRKNFGAKACLYPQPVFIIGTYDENGIPNAMNAAWGGISESTEISICVDSEHKTAKNILLKKAFTVSMADEDHVTECDYVGVVSGSEVPDKVEKAGFHTMKAEYVDAPLFEELPMTLECKLISYDEETCRLVGEIVNVSADMRIIGDDGKINPAKLRPITYDSMNHAYLVLGEKVGNAFKDGLKLKDGAGQETEEEESGVRKDILRFLDAEGATKKLEVLRELRLDLDEELMTTIEVSMDLVPDDKESLERRYDFVVRTLEQRIRYETGRLR